MNQWRAWKAATKTCKYWCVRQASEGKKQIFEAAARDCRRQLRKEVMIMLSSSPPENTCKHEDSKAQWGNSDRI